MGITRPREILEEVTKLRMFEITSQIVKFLREEYGLASTVEATKPNEFIDIYLSNYRHNEDIETELPNDKIAKSILKMFNEIHKDEGLSAINVWPTEFGYTIVLDTGDKDGDELNENYLYYYYYSKATETNDLNKNYDMRQPLTEAKEDEEALLNKLVGDARDKPKQKAESEPEPEVLDKPTRFSDRDEVERDSDNNDRDKDITKDVDEVKRDKENLEQDLSNTVLDNRFIWFFSILDGNADEISSEIDNLDDAIDLLINEVKAAMLVAYPYIDPNPEDEHVELVFADNPGPVIIYDSEGE